MITCGEGQAVALDQLSTVGSADHGEPIFGVLLKWMEVQSAMAWDEVLDEGGET